VSIIDFLYSISSLRWGDVDWGWVDQNDLNVKISTYITWTYIYIKKLKLMDTIEIQ